MNGKYGYRIDKEKRAELIAEPQMTIPRGFARAWAVPPEVDPRPWHRIENQGKMGSCQGHALSSVMEMLYHLAMNEVIQFSPWFAYRATQLIDGITGDRGSTIYGGMNCAKQYGICEAAVFPYPKTYNSQPIPDEVFEAAKKFKIRSHKVISSYADAFQFISTGLGGVEIGIAWPDSWMNLPSGTVLDQYPGGDGGHALCFLGYSLNKDRQGRNNLWMANSWSEDWDDGGWAEVTAGCVDSMLRSPDTVMIGLSDLTVPTPRPFSWAGTFA